MNIIQNFTHFGNEMKERRISIKSEVVLVLGFGMGMTFGFDSEVLRK